jgi:NAD(P)-dependent dehydrogenase (short-subunit alcohol dehydrogenase family)
MSLQNDLSEKRAFVTGVTSGIGAGIARALAVAGCHVAGCGRSAAGSKGAKAFVQSVEAEGVTAAYVQADIAKRGAAAPAIDAVVEQLGGLDLLVSNAGRNVFKGAEKASDADWDECMELDLAAHWRIAQAARPHVRQASPGVILIIGSNHA